MSLLVGKEVPWSSIKNIPMVVEHFTALAKVENGKAINPPGAFNLDPYALVEASTPVCSDRFTVPIAHRVDFQHLWEIFQEQGIKDDERVVMSYSPSKFLSGFKPRFKIITTKEDVIDFFKVKDVSDKSITRNTSK